MTDTQTDEQLEKAAYAAFLLEHRDPFKAALAMIPDDNKRAFWIAVHWPKDEAVIAETARLKGPDGMAGLASKRDLAKDIWTRMQGTVYPNGTVVPLPAEDYAKLAKLYADVMNYIEKPLPPSQTTNVFLPKAIEVPTHGTDAEWEAAAEAQQAQLLSVSRSRH